MRPLENIKVVDLSHAISGPTCTQMLVQLGADVVKVEPPGEGDAFRHYTEHAGFPGMAVPFVAVNAGKRSITVNLKSAEGRDVLWRMIEGADILVENFRPGVLARLGFAQDVLMVRNPRLITASISGFGQQGPLRDWGAYDHIAQAMSGIALMNAGADGPRKIGMPIIDSFSGYLAVIGLMAALRTRDTTGRGGAVDIAMLDAALKLIATSVTVNSFTGEPPLAIGNRGYRMVATSEFYSTAEGWIALGANHQHQVAALFAVLGHAELIGDPRFSDHAARTAHYDGLRAWLIDALSRERAAELEPRLTAAGVPAAMLRDVGQIVGHPHIAGRGTLQKAGMPGREEPLSIVGPGFAVDPPAPPLAAPALGADTDDVLAELGYDAAERAHLREGGAV